MKTILTILSYIGFICLVATSVVFTMGKPVPTWLLIPAAGYIVFLVAIMVVTGIMIKRKGGAAVLEKLKQIAKEERRK